MRSAPLVLLLAAACGNGASPSPGASSALGSASANAPSSVATPNAALGGAPILPGAREGSSVVLTPEGDLAIVADEDHSTIDLVSLPVFDDKPPMHVEPPGRPAQLAMVGGTLLATIRELKSGGGALVAYERAGDGKGLTESWRAALPADAWGIAVSPDGTLAAVTSAWTGKVSLVDLSKHEVVWTRDVGREPRGIAFVSDGDSIFVSHLVEAPITRIDKVRGDATVTNVDLPAAAVRAPSGDKLTATLGYSVVISPDGSRAFFPRHALGTIGSRDWNGSPAVDVLDVATQAPVATPHQINGQLSAVEDFDPNSPKSQIFSYQDVASDVVAQGANAFVVPRAAVYRPNARSILVASEDGSSIVELDALMSDPTLGPMHTYDVSNAPTGIALSHDGNIAFVYCRAGDRLEVVHLATVEGPQEAAPPPHVTLADPPTDKIYALGRAAFYSQCSSCHPEGRDDGHVWHEVQFGKESDKESFANLISTTTAVRHLTAFSKSGHDVAPVPDPVNVDSVGAGYARQTPMLVNRVKALGPYGWRGLDEDLNARILHGFRLHQWGRSFDDGPHKGEAYQIGEFIRKGLVPPPAMDRPLSDEERHGQEVFTSAKTECATCHVPSTDYTNRTIPPLAQAGPAPGFVLEPDATFKTPSLLYVGGSPPYMHDGRYATLEDLIDKNMDRMGKTTQLSEEDKKALVAFLKTL